MTVQCNVVMVDLQVVRGGLLGEAESSANYTGVSYMARVFSSESSKLEEELPSCCRVLCKVAAFCS